MGYENGKQKIKSMTYHPPKNLTERQIKREVEKQAVIFENKCFNNLDGLPQDSKEDYTFRELAEEWIDLMEASKAMTPKTICSLKTTRSRTYNAIGDKYIDEIKYKDIQNFIRDLARPNTCKRTGKGLKQKTQKQYITLISNVMKYAIKCGIIKENPCTDIITIKNEEHEDESYKYYTMDELKAILQAIDRNAETKYKVLFRILAYCGLRAGEVLGIEYNDIDFSTGITNICRTSEYTTDSGTYTSNPKTKTSRRKIKLNKEILDLILQLRTEQSKDKLNCGDLWDNSANDRLFIQWNGKQMHPNTPYTYLKRLCKRENLPFKGLHAFRHSFATQDITSGLDIKSVSACLGHSQTSTTLNIYAHAIDKCNESVFDLMSDLISNTNSKPNTTIKPA